MTSEYGKIKTVFSVTILIMFILAACGGGESTGQPLTVEEMLTNSVGTIAASIVQTQTALAPTITSTATVTSTSTATSTSTPNLIATITPSATYWYFTATSTFGPTFTPSPTGTLSTATINPSSLAYGCNNLLFIRDVSYPSGTVVQPKESFTKTWKVANNGTCDWLYQYTLEFLSANYPVSGAVKLGRVVTVNDWAEISLNLEAPRNPGTYTSYWRLSDGAGHMFGSTLAASFKIEAPTAPSPIPTDTPSPTPSATPTPTFTPLGP